MATPVTVIVNEQNGAGAGSETVNISNCKYGSGDSANLTPASSTIDAGNNSYEKYWRIELDALGNSTSIEDIKCWRVAALGGSAVHKTNCVTGGTPSNDSYVAPVTTGSTVATTTMPSKEPQTSNVGVGATEGGSITSAGNKSNYIVTQIQTDAGDSGATAFWIMFSFFESQ